MSPLLLTPSSSLFCLRRRRPRTAPNHHRSLPGGPGPSLASPAPSPLTHPSNTGLGTQSPHPVQRPGCKDGGKPTHTMSAFREAVFNLTETFTVTFHESAGTGRGKTAGPLGPLTGALRQAGSTLGAPPHVLQGEAGGFGSRGIRGGARVEKVFWLRLEVPGPTRRQQGSRRAKSHHRAALPAPANAPARDWERAAGSHGTGSRKAQSANHGRAGLRGRDNPEVRGRSFRCETSTLPEGVPAGRHSPGLSWSSSALHALPFRALLTEPFPRGPLSLKNLCPTGPLQGQLTSSPEPKVPGAAAPGARAARPAPARGVTIEKPPPLWSRLTLSMIRPGCWR